MLGSGFCRQSATSYMSVYAKCCGSLIGHHGPAPSFELNTDGLEGWARHEYPDGAQDKVYTTTGCEVTGVAKPEGLPVSPDLARGMTCKFVCGFMCGYCALFPCLWPCMGLKPKGKSAAFSRTSPKGATSNNGKAIELTDDPKYLFGKK